MVTKPTYEELQQRINDLEKERASIGNVHPPSEDSEIAYRLMLESISDTVITADDQGNITYVCPNTTIIFGLSPDEVYKLGTIQRLMGGHICDIKHLKEVGEKKNIEWSIIDASKVERSLLINAKSVSIKNCTVLFVMRDITDRRQMEDELRISEKRYRRLFEKAPIMVQSIDPVGKLRLVSDYWLATMGYEREEVIGKYSTDFLTEKSRREANEIYLPEFFKHGAIKDIPYQMVKKNGEIIDVLLSAILDKDADGNIMRSLASVIDISARKQMEEALAQSELKWRNILVNIPQIGISLDMKARIVFANEYFLKLTGWKKEEIIGKDWFDLFIPENIKEEVRNVFDLNMERKNNLEYSNYENEILTKSGRLLNVAWSNLVSTDAQGEVVEVTCLGTDLTERNRMEEQLRHAYKMESIGTLVGGIAHEFNNILSIVFGNNELIMEETSEGSTLYDYSKEIRLASIRARDMIQQLLMFSRSENANHVPIDLRFVVRDSFKLLRTSTPAYISMVKSLSDRAGVILGNAAQINQLLINLCSNAADAIEGTGGMITIALEKITISDDKNEKFLSKVVPGKYAKLVVSDNGCGISKENVEKIFDPYFTTKDIGKGMGIGLAVVHGIVESHNGAIFVESEPEGGTIFTILFPVYQGKTSKKSHDKGELPVGNERILFVDDEPSIVKLAVMRLEKLGYSVLGSTDPKEAIKVFAADPDAFDLVITDMAMPHMTGEQLVSKILAIRPGMPTILCTGYSEEIDQKKADKLGISSFAMKPLEKTDFAMRVRKVLDEAQGKEMGI